MERTPRVRLIIAATLLASLLTPLTASARAFRWTGAVNNQWTNKDNWEYIPGPGGPGVGYPDGLGDQASFASTSNALRSVTIPANVAIRVGVIGFGGGGQFFIQGGNAASRLILDNGILPPQILRTELSSATPGSDVIAVPITLVGNVDIHVPANESLAFADITDDGLARGITKYGGGEIILQTATTYGGRTIVSDGTLRVPSYSTSVLGNLVVGNASGVNATARIERADAIADAASVEVKSDGGLVLAGSDRIADLTITRGYVTVSNASTLRMRNLAMSDQARLASEGGSRFVLDGHVYATGTATIAGTPGTGAHLDLGTSSHTILVNPLQTQIGRLVIDIPLVGAGSAGFVKDGSGTVVFIGPGANTYPGETRVLTGSLLLDRPSVTVPGNLQIGFGAGGSVTSWRSGSIADTANVVVGANGTLVADGGQDVIGSLTVTPGGRVWIGNHNATHLSGGTLTVQGADISFAQESTLTLRGDMFATSVGMISARLIGHAGSLALTDGQHNVTVEDGPQDVDLSINVRITGASANATLVLPGKGTAYFGSDNTYAGPTGIANGTLLVFGQQPASRMIAFSGTLGGGGRVGDVSMGPATLAPMHHLETGKVVLAPESTFRVELASFNPSEDLVARDSSRLGVRSRAVKGRADNPFVTRDQLVAHGEVRLNNATLVLTLGEIHPLTSFTIIDNDGTDAIVGTFAGIDEGAVVTVGAKTFKLSYRGGDGNDVVLSLPAGPGPSPGPGPGPADPVTYFLAEGATGGFFDDDVLIANPNETAAPVTLTFLQEGGSTVVEQRTVAPQSRMTVHVDQIAGLESTSASVQVVSDNKLPLIVERSMFWDASYYGGHTANAVARPELKWIFAEGFQGFFDTYILIANTNDQPATATLTFLREGDTPIVTTVPIDAFARKTVFAGDYPDLVGRAFGIIVDATHPVIAERSMYFASLPGRLWTGGHVNTGIVAPSSSWFHAEGATGGFFNTFILLSNPQDTAAHVELRFLLDTGEVITREKTIEARQRLTINPATEGDTRLENAAVSTVVTSDVPIVSERSMYWGGDATPFGEGHNSSGVVNTWIRWGLAEGRIGGPHAFDTFILLANPSSQAAEVTITYLRESGAPIVKTHTVPATSRFNIDVKSVVPELIDTSFGARIEVTNNVPIAVERSLYWNANGVFWAGGTNALATLLP